MGVQMDKILEMMVLFFSLFFFCGANNDGSFNSKPSTINHQNDNPLTGLLARVMWVNQLILYY